MSDVAAHHDESSVSDEQEQALSDVVTMTEWVAIVVALGAFEAFELGVGLMRAAIDQIPVGSARSGNS